MTPTLGSGQHFQTPLLFPKRIKVGSSNLARRCQVLGQRIKKLATRGRSAMYTRLYGVGEAHFAILIQLGVIAA